MARSTPILVGVPLLIVATIWGIYVLATRHTALERQLVTVAPEDLALGDVWLQSDYELQLPIRNVSEKKIEIVGFRTSCQCTSIEPTPLVIQPRSTSRVTMTIDLMPRSKSQPLSASRPFRIRVAPVIKQALRTRTVWSIHGQVYSPFQVERSDLRFDQPLIRGDGGVSLEATVICHQPVQKLVTICDPSIAGVDIIRGLGDVQTSSNFRLRVTPHSTLSAGIHKFNLLIGAVLQDGEPVPSVKFPLSLEVVEDISAVPSFVSLGGVAIDETVEQVITLVSHSGNEFRVIHIEVESTDTSVEPFTETIYGHQRFRVVQRITEEGANASLISFLVEKRGEEEHIAIPVRVSYFGVARTSIEPGAADITIN